jgi:hypothetical protein
MSIAVTAKSDGPSVMVALIFTVPATVPVNTMTGDANTTVVPFAGTVKFTVRVPFENCVIGSSVAISAFEVNVKVSLPASALGYDSANVTESESCCAGFTVAGRLGAEKAGNCALTVIVKLFVLTTARESVTVTTIFCDSTAVGVP